MKVVETGSFTAAAGALDLTTSMASRAITDLEAHLRTRLLNRTTRSIALTEAGERYVRRAEKIIADLDAAEAEASRTITQAAGTLRVTSSMGLARHIVLPAITQYRIMNPRVDIELTANQTVPDLLDSHSDVAIVAARTLPDSRFVARKLGTTFSVLCASADYVHTRGVPTTPEELSGYDCLVLRTSAYPDGQWHLRGGKGDVVMAVHGPMKTNTAEMLSVAIGEGMGIGCLPLHAAIDKIQAGTFLQILPDYRLQEVDIYAIYASRVYIDAKIKTWIDYLASEVPKIIAYNEKALAASKMRDFAHKSIASESAPSICMLPPRTLSADRMAPHGTAMQA
jgi:DNA-binding transcriptional LysR family regulator